MNIEIIKSIILNIGLLIVIAEVLARVRMVKRFIIGNQKSVKDQIAMALIFGSISILCTYMGYGVNGAFANTRVIAVMAAGLIGGPFVGLGTSIIAGLHRYLFDINGLTAVACTISTILEGIIAAAAYNHIKKNKYQEFELFLITFISEAIQMITILIVAKPYEAAFSLVREIALPMMLLNSLGMVFFMSIFKRIFVEQAYEVSKRLSLTFDITKKCLPLLSTGKYNQETTEQIGEIILEHTKDLAILFTATDKIVSVKGNLTLTENQSLPEFAKRIMENKKAFLVEEAPVGDFLHSPLEKMVAIGAPLQRNGEVFGSLIILTHRYQFTYLTEMEFVEGLCQFFSVQFGLAEVEKQKELLRKVEFRILQSQINPHFIFNSLNTISAFCREKPYKARELLIALASYFRSSIKTKDNCISIYEEMDYISAYLQLEKARFEDRLKLNVSIAENLDCQVPCLILQPIVENAINHGAMKRRQGEVDITVIEDENEVLISISDNGMGIPNEIIKGLKDDTLENESIGLSNVEKRLCYMYGKDHGLDIRTSENGTTILIRIPLSPIKLNEAFTQ
ncbi:MAG: LytS/YhcK type 5TM receptor domain-containing protein [Clostridiaceae bacterium]